MSKVNTIEVLAPAGNRAALEAAVFSGADAVYLGGALFSARAGAVNFGREELQEAAEFARMRGVKCYVTFNTLIKEGELQEAMEFTAFLCSLPVDGVIVQDLGLFRLLRQCCPGLPVHCSTQMSLHTPWGVALCRELGARRAVLARELSLTEIREIHDSVDIDLEVFVHGALCMSVSGQCYFSAMLGSRSGNRGRCAQTCRLPFAATGGTGHDLSLKDLSFIEEMAELRAAGVSSAKIEGRMKRPEYVAAAVSAARQAADGQPVPGALMDNLEAVFSRSGFTKGYLLGKTGRDMFGIRTKEDVVSGTSQLFGELHGLYKEEYRRVPLTMELTVLEGEFPVLFLEDDRGNRVTVTGEIKAQKAIHRALTQEELSARLGKLGGTPYYAETLICRTDGLSALGASAINALRRSGVEELNKRRMQKPAVDFLVPELKTEPHLAGKMQLRAVFASMEQVPEGIQGLQWIYLPLDAAIEDFLQLQVKGVSVGAHVPRGLFGGHRRARRTVEKLMKEGIHVFLCDTLDAVALCRDAGAEIHGGFSLNVTNSYSLQALEELGLRSAELSFELTLGEIGALGGTMERGLMVYGRQALMLVRNCPLANGGCKNCAQPGFLTDRRGAKFPVMCPRVVKDGKISGKVYDSAEVFNSVPLSLSDRMGEITGADFGVLRFTVENSVEAGRIIGAFIRQEKPCCDYTRGLFYRGVL